VRELDIGEVVQRSGVPASTVRFYEEKGLISSIGRRGLRRLFDPGILERFVLISLGRAAGFSLDEIALMFAPDGRPHINRQMLTAKADDLDKTIHQLSAMRDGLRHAAACPAATHMECPTFQRILRAAETGAIRVRKKRVLPVPPPPSLNLDECRIANEFIDCAFGIHKSSSRQQSSLRLWVCEIRNSRSTACTSRFKSSVFREAHLVPHSGNGSMPVR